ncbi:MAG: sugar phosphate isomerase/epimerase, partial [Flavobacteriaceae bacterium]|nr:sugar phosphate isomerase/epimerase [Flavobacteriaceae bacterium]
MKIQNISQKIAFFLILMLTITLSCKNEEKPSVIAQDKQEEMTKEPFFKLSLAQWSIHKMIENEGLDPFDFAKKSKAWGFEGIEYVSQLYSKELAKYDDQAEGMNQLVARLKKESETAGIQNLLIMVDGEGDLADPDEDKRNLAVENHKKWVDAAAELGCHS